MYRDGQRCVRQCDSKTYVKEDSGNRCVPWCNPNKYYEKPSTSGECIGLCEDGEVFYNESCNSRCPDDEYQYNGICVTDIPSGTYFVKVKSDESKLIVARCPHQYY